ncbi:hypothetical protein JCM11641_002184 [Rhodosporidiobolus odoratus]
MRLLSSEQSASHSTSTKDTEVTAPDQSRINRFSILVSRADEVGEELDRLKKEREELEEVEGEVELVEMEGLGDEEEELDDLNEGEAGTGGGGGEEGGKIMYKLDSTFLSLSPTEVLDHLRSSLEKNKDESDRLEKEREEGESEMDGLKKELYAKFGDSINLERGDD